MVETILHTICCLFVFLLCVGFFVVFMLCLFCVFCGFFVVDVFVVFVLKILIFELTMANWEQFRRLCITRLYQSDIIHADDDMSVFTAVLMVC